MNSNQGPPQEGNEFNGIIKMIIIQTIQGRITSRKGWSGLKKFLCLVFIFLALTTYDLQNILSHEKRAQNYYEIFKLDRSANNQQIKKAIEEIRDELRDNFHMYQMEKSTLTLDLLDDIEHALTNPVLRDIYDKSLIIVTREEFKERGNQFPLSHRYFQAFGVCMHFSIFFILIFFMIDKHQVFAKQFSMTSILVAIYLAVYIKLPKEGEKDNQIADFLNKHSLLMNLTFHEIFLIIQKIFSNLFHLIMSVSRMIDQHPLEELSSKLKSFQKLSAKCLLICELIAPLRQMPIEQPPQDQIQDENQAPQDLIQDENQEPQDQIQDENQDGSIVQQPSLIKSTVELQLELEEKKKKNYIDAMKFVGEDRSKKFMETFQRMLDKKLQEEKQTSRLRKCCRLLGKIAIGVAVLAIVSPMLMGMYQQYNRQGENKDGKPMSFDEFKSQYGGANQQEQQQNESVIDDVLEDYKAEMYQFEQEQFNENNQDL